MGNEDTTVKKHPILFGCNVRLTTEKCQICAMQGFGGTVVGHEGEADRREDEDDQAA